MTDRPSGPFELRIPAQAIHVATARLFIATLGRALGYPEDLVDDLRLVVSEAVSAGVRSSGHKEIVVGGDIGSDSMTIVVSPIDQDTVSEDQFDVGPIVLALFPASHWDGAKLVIPVIRADGVGS